MDESTTSSHYDVIIIGAGVCGLYAGLTFVRNGKSVLIIEKEPRVGGLAAGFKFGENYCDFGVHMLHAFNQEIFEDCAELMGEERIEAALDARIRWGNTTCRYPLKFGDMLRAMPLFTLFRCVAGLLIAEVSGSKKRSNIENAEEALISYYGTPLYEFFFEEFTDKYWGIHPRELSAEFVRRKMPRLSAIDFIRKCMPAFGAKQNDLVESALNVETLHYSKTGTETLPRSLSQEFERLGGVIKKDTSITAITELKNEYNIFTNSASWRANLILNTAPVGSFIEMLSCPDLVVEAASKLSYKPTVVWALLVKRDKCMEGLYTYYRNRLFHRVGEPKNAGLEVKPDGHSILIVETTCDVGDDKWNDSEAIREQIVQDLEEEGIINSRDIVDWLHLKNAYAYPVYDLNFDSRLNTVTDWIDSKKTIASTGRQGGFTYPAMHTAMQMGKDAALKMLENNIK